jgi:hypothetical protein
MASKVGLARRAGRPIPVAEAVRLSSAVRHTPPTAQRPPLARAPSFDRMRHVTFRPSSVTLRLPSVQPTSSDRHAYVIAPSCVRPTSIRRTSLSVQVIAPIQSVGTDRGVHIRAKSVIGIRARFEVPTFRLESSDTLNRREDLSDRTKRKQNKAHGKPDQARRRFTPGPTAGGALRPDRSNGRGIKPLPQNPKAPIFFNHVPSVATSATHTKHTKVIAEFVAESVSLSIKPSSRE